MAETSSWVSLEARFGRFLRNLTWIAFIPALPMLITHGILSRDVVPAAGLIPQSISAVAGIWLLRCQSKPSSDTNARGDESGSDMMRRVERNIQDGIQQIDELGDKFSHPLLIFAFDIVVAVGIMVVLVCTWNSSSQSAGLGMLAAYATIPLMLSFVSHAALAFSALWDGLAVYGHMKWAASRAIDSDCPNCSHNLWPDRPKVPWSRFLDKKKPVDYAPVFTDGESYHSDQDEGGHMSGYGIEPETVSARVKKPGKKTTAANVDETSALLAE